MTGRKSVTKCCLFINTADANPSGPTRPNTFANVSCPSVPARPHQVIYLAVKHAALHAKALCAISVLDQLTLWWSVRRPPGTDLFGQLWYLNQTPIGVTRSNREVQLNRDSAADQRSFVSKILKCSVIRLGRGYRRVSESFKCRWNHAQRSDESG
jgi:hypothetical protein